jgi:glycosyltransferase involved in cell wall biosynthesis
LSPTQELRCALTLLEAQPSRTPYPLVSVIVPTRNEAKNLEIVLPAIAAVRPAVHEIIVVDGNSTDGSIDVARRVLPSVKRSPRPARARATRWRAGSPPPPGDVVVMFDADGSPTRPRSPRSWPRSSRAPTSPRAAASHPAAAATTSPCCAAAATRGLNGVANTLFGTAYSDLCYGYNAFWADLLPLLDLPPIEAPATAAGMLWGDGFEIETVLNCRVAAAGLRITEVPSVERQRMFGETNLRTFADGARVLRTLIAEHRRARTR